MTRIPASRPAFSRRIGRPTRPEEVDRIVPALTRWYLEYLAGHRTLDQLGDLVTPAVAARLRQRLGDPRGGPAVPDPGIAATAVLRWTTRWTSATRCEATVLVDRDGRTTALAITLQRHPDRWRVTDLASPEDGVPALRATPVPDRPGRAGDHDDGMP